MIELSVTVILQERGSDRKREQERCREDGRLAKMTLRFVFDMPKGVGTTIR